MQIISTKDNSIRFHNVRVYRPRSNLGKYNQKYSREQLTYIMNKNPNPDMMDTHNYHIPVCGHWDKCWFGSDGWMHASGNINVAAIGPHKANQIRKRIRTGEINQVSISVARQRLRDENGRETEKWDPDPRTMRLVEISFCKKGEHKKTDIVLVEASDNSQNKSFINTEGDILEIHMSNPTQLPVTPEEERVLNILEEAAAAGIKLTDEETNAMTVSNGSDLEIVKTVLSRVANAKKLAEDRFSEQENELKELREMKKQMAEQFQKEREPIIGELVNFFGAEIDLLKVDDAARAKLKEESTALVKSLGGDPQTQLAFQLLQIGAKKSQAAKAELDKMIDVQKQAKLDERRAKLANLRGREATIANERANPKTDARDASPLRETDAGTLKTAPLASVPAKGAKSNVALPSAGRSAGLDAHEVAVTASSGQGNLQWIDAYFPFAATSSYSGSVVSKTMDKVREIMGEADFTSAAGNTVVPPIGQQGFQKSATRMTWG